MIVEDNVWDREGLASFLDWSDLNIEIVGIASNGIQGLRMAKEYDPDIITTDIRMPIMDGLELSREVKTFSSKCKILIITGYDDFQYAKDAINIGVYDYLLKPVEKEQLLNAINKAIREIRQESQQEEYVSNLKAQISEQTFKEREQFLLSLIKGKDKCRKDWLEIEGLDFYFYSQKTVAMVIRVNGFSYNRETDYYYRQDHFKGFYKRIREMVADIGLTAVSDIEKGEMVIALPVRQEVREEVRNIIDQIQQQNYGIKKSDYIIGVGSLSNTVSDFTRSFKHARATLDRLFFMKDTNILFYDDFAQQHEKQEYVGYKFLHSARDYTKRIHRAVVSLDAQGVIALTNELFNFIYNHIVDKSLACSFLANVVHELSVLLLLESDSNSIYNAGEDLLERFHSCIKLEQLKVWMQDLLIYTNQRFIKKRKNREEYIIDEVMNSITNHYKENIGLGAMADSLGLSPNYLGSLFKKHIGKCFTEVLTSFRIEKAEELLISGKDSVKDIAKAVGFGNSSYFCTVFKKIHGISPMEYREKKADETKDKG